MKRIITRNIMSTAIAAALLCAVALPVHATTITVTNTNDSGVGSLRQALTIANDGDTVTFAVTGTITLTSGELLVDKNVTISGPGADNLAVDGNATSRVFHVGSGKTVTISGLTITHGNASGDFPVGGGIYNDHATLTLNYCMISGNFAAEYWHGGGIYNDGDSGSSSLQISNTVLSGNSAAEGAGIFNSGYFGIATVGVENTRFDSNSADFGGGIYNYQGTLTLTGCAFSGNTAMWAGAVENEGAYNPDFTSSTVAITNCTFSANSVQYQGGAISNITDYQGIATVAVTNSTFSGNSAYAGGAVFMNGNEGAANVSIRDSTLAGNSPEFGSCVENLGGSVEIGNTILQSPISGGTVYNENGPFVSRGYNLSSDDGGGFLTGPGDQINTNPMLGPLQNNGGPTLTRALLPGSPAIDAGDPSFTPPPFYDQRGLGFDRVVNGRIDIGSFEVQGQIVGIQLQATGRRVHGIHAVDLSWTGATSTDVDIFRDGTLVITVPDTGSYTDSTGNKGGNVRYTYKVCEAGTSTCSNEVTVRFGGAPIP